MKVKELLEKVDTNKMGIEYVRELNKSIFGPSITYGPYIGKVIKDSINEIVNTKSLENHNILVVMEQSNEWDDTYMVFYVKPKEIKEKYLDIPAESLMKRDGSYIDIYGILFDSWEDIANMEICDLSLEKYGEDNVALAVLMEMTRFGFDAKSVKQKNEEIIDEIRKSEENIKEEECRSFEEVMKELNEKYDLEEKDKISDEEIYASITDEYRRRQEFFKYIYESN